MEQTPTSRWMEISQTSPSGKMLFVCRSCGQRSPTPDKECASGTAVYHDGTVFKMPCSVWPMDPHQWAEMDIAKRIEGKEAYFIGVVYLPDGPMTISGPIDAALARQLACHSVEFQIRESERKANPQQYRQTRKTTLDRIKEQTSANTRDLENQKAQRTRFADMTVNPPDPGKPLEFTDMADLLQYVPHKSETGK